MGDFGFGQGVIARRLFFQVVFLSLLASAVISAVQIYFRYGEKLRSVENELQRIETSHLDSLATNLWHMDEALLHTELQGIMNLPNIQFVEVHSQDGQRIALGTAGTGDHVTHEHPLVFLHRGILTQLGALTIHVDLNSIRRALWQDAAGLSVGEAGKICVIALLVFFLFQFTVGRHLRNLARQAFDLDLRRPQSPFHIHRPSRKKKVADELEFLSSSLNELYVNLTATIANLRHANEKLDKEMDERKRAEESLRQANLVVENSPVVVFRWQAIEGWPVDMVSQNVSQFGYSREELLAGVVPFASMVHPDDLQRVGREVQEYSTGGTDRFGQVYRMLTKDGAVRWVDDRTVVERNDDGRITFYQGIVIDITERKHAEELLQSSLAEKDSLLKEVHHRVKNNLQIISSLLSLQGRKVQNPEALDLLQDAQNRVRSMALLHETLYRSGNLARVDFPQYVKSICNHLVRSCACGAENIRLRQDIADVALDMDQAIPAGLIISELVTNALKHAFPSRAEGEISVELQVAGEQHLVLRVSDNGVGFPAERRLQSSETLGLILVKNLSRQLDGQLSIKSEHGTVFEIVFPAHVT